MLPASHGNKKARRDGKKSAITRELDMYTNIYKLRHASNKDRKQSNTKHEDSAQKPQKNPQAPHETLHKREFESTKLRKKTCAKRSPYISQSVRKRPQTSD